MKLGSIDGSCGPGDVGQKHPAWIRGLFVFTNLRLISSANKMAE